MNQAISVELQFFLISVLWGGILLLVYDCLRIFRRLIKHDSFFVALEDLIFWVAASLFIFAMMYKENNGIIRGFSVMGMAIGMVLYHYILSDFLVNIITKLIQALISPFVFAIKKVKQFIKFIWTKGKKALYFIIRRLKKCIKSVKIILNKRQQARAVKQQKRSEKKLLKKNLREKKIFEKNTLKKIALEKKLLDEKKASEKKALKKNKLDEKKVLEKKALEKNKLNEKKVLEKKVLDKNISEEKSGSKKQDKKVKGNKKIS